MSLDIPVTYRSYRGPIGPAEKWDMLAVGRMLSGEEGRPAGAFRFVQTPWDPDDGMGRVLVVPVGDNLNCTQLLLADLEALPWCLLIATSDERSLFGWHRINPWPENTIAWIMTPRPGFAYPPGARFIGEGAPVRGSWAAFTRDLDMFFSGQVSNDRRKLALPAMKDAEHRLGKTKIVATGGFLRTEDDNPITKPGGDVIYLNDMSRAWLAPCPAGTSTQDSFRLYEALESGCIPIADELSPQGNKGYWEMLGLDDVFPRIEFWRDLPVMTEQLLVDRHATAAHISSRWQQYKRRLRNQLHDDVHELVKIRKSEPPHDAITVIIPTSPVPSNPDLSMIQDLIASVRINLPESEILIACDTPREEMAHRTENYHVFLHRLCVWALSQFNVTVFTTHRHCHESGLLKMVMPEVRTPFVLFCEHDAPLIAPVDFQACLDEMETHGLRHLRFGHENHVLPEHEYLYPFGTEPAGNHIKTVQYSSRPALYTTELMNELLDVYFDDEATCMIESVLYGPFQTDVDTKIAEAGTTKAFADRLRLQAAWGRYRSALWAPGPNLAFSGHVDGRGGDPNVPILISYPGGVVPPGAPQPGEVRI